MDSLNQLFLTLIKLKLNLKERDLAYRFGIAVSVVSKYFNTWVCFLHHHLSEIERMTDVDQVKDTLPYVKYVWWEVSQLFVVLVARFI